APEGMVRGRAKEDAQQKNAAKSAKDLKSGSQIQAQKNGMKVQCPACLLESTSYKMLLQHFESKHPKLDVPSEEACSKEK
ncbi:unnamed protein product, partial [Polarella glacialis]